MPQGEAIFAFRNTRDVIMAERTLLDSGVEVRVMPTPRIIGPACGMVLRINSDDVEKVITMLGESVSGIYRREGERIVPWQN